MEKSIINFKEVGFRTQSKSEIYRALVTEGKLYPPPIKETSMLFISQLAVGEKKIISSLFVFHKSFCAGTQSKSSGGLCFAPRQGLSSKELIEFLINY